MNDNCLVCGGPLSDSETLRRRAWHDDCNKCPICGHGPLEEDLLVKQLARGQAIGHTTCIHSAAMRELKDKTIPMRIEHIDALNKDMNTQFFGEIDPKDIDLLYDILAKGKELCANVSLVISRSKERIAQAETQKYREKTKEQKQAEREATRRAAEIEIDKTKRAATLAAEREDPKLKVRRKAIEAWMSIGYSLEIATQMVDEKKQ